MQVIYDGPFTRIRVLPVSGGEVEATRGEAIELPDDLAASLVAGGEWRPADGKKRAGEAPQEGE